MKLRFYTAAPLVLLAACAAPRPGPESVSSPVRPGAEVLAERLPEVLRGRRVGLITNQTGVDRSGTSTIDRLAAMPELRLVALFSPEHGIRGAAAPGESIASGADPRTGLPIHSLYGDIRKPTPEMLAGIDALVFDIQDVGARTYTYVYTMALAMRAAAEQGIPFVVLDRPNPLGGVTIEGNLLDTTFATFVGMYPVPVRHAMTVGELARLWNATEGIGAELTVVPVAGWRREMTWEATGLPWIPPSPNLPSPQAALHYPGTVFFEGTNLSAGRGTDHPFEQVGAPWLDAKGIAERMNARGLPGVRFEAVRFTPRDPGDAKWPDTTVAGVRLIATDPDAYRPVRTSLRLIDEIHRAHPAEMAWFPSHFDRLAGTDRLRQAVEGGTLDALLREWEADAERFRALREPYLLYE